MDIHHPKLRPTRDHLTPRRFRGTQIVICCLKCNSMKGDMLPLQWVIFMIDHPRWWEMTRKQWRARFRGLRTKRREREKQPRKRCPVVVPPELIYRDPLPIEHSKFILDHGKRAWREFLASSLAEDAAACHVGDAG